MRLSANNSGQQVTIMLLRSTVERTYLHFNPPGIVVIVSKVSVSAIAVLLSSIIFSIVSLCYTVTTGSIIIIIIYVRGGSRKFVELFPEQL